MDNYKFLGDDKELNWFFDNILTKPERGESYLMCLSSRAKKVPMEERARIQLGRGEMMRESIITPRGKERIWDYPQFRSFVRRYEFPVDGMLTKAGFPYPQNSLVCFIYVNPSDEDAVAVDQMDHTVKILSDLLHSCRKYEKGEHAGIVEQLDKLGGLDVHKKTCRGIHIARHIWTQFDFDFSDEVKRNQNLIYTVATTLRKVGNGLFGKGKVAIIRTSGGFHILVHKDGMRYWNDELRKKGEKPFGNTLHEPISDFLTTVIDILHDKDSTVKWYDEWVKTNQSFLPCPGTLQYGDFVVTVINKEDFC